MALAAGLALLAANAASAAPIHIGGVDVETQYTGFVGAPTDAGVLTFNDHDNGHADAAPGVVTSSDLAALLGAAVNFEVKLSPLDVNGDPFDPAAGDVRLAQFIGLGSMPEITIVDNTATVLLAFQVHLLDVQQAAHSGTPIGTPDGKIVLGNPQIENFGIASNLTVAGGTLSALVGGVGTPAVMELLMSSLNPEMTKALRDSTYLNTDFSNGVGTSLESTTWNITIIPEPSTAVLLGFALLGVLASARRRAPR
jgi:hypothetical protein